MSVCAGHHSFKVFFQRFIDFFEFADLSSQAEKLLLLRTVGALAP